MSQNVHHLSPADPYHSAYRGSVTAPDGSFDHFLRIVYPIHESKGYWRFHSIEDERRAFALGLSTPEMVLLAVDRGDGPFDDIILRWLPGSMDKGNKPSFGTAAAHLESICNELRLLGKPLSFRGRVPTYPIITESTDPTLLNFRLVKYGLEKGNLRAVSLVETHKQRTRSQNEVVLSTEKHGSTARRFDSSLATSQSTLDTLTSPITDVHQDLSIPLDPDLSEPPTPRMESSQQPRLSRPKRHSSPISRTSGPTSVGLVSFESAVTTAESPEQELEFVEFSKMNNQLPCIDCEQVGSHCWGCNIGSIEALQHLTTSDYHDLVDAVTRFDPQPWTTHAGPPKQPERVDPATRTKEMAQTIRLLESYENDTQLHALPDGVLMFMWALTVTPGVEIVQD
jgi:hypothetical protein